MAALKRNRATWILILLLAGGFFLLRENRGLGSPPPPPSGVCPDCNTATTTTVSTTINLFPGGTVIIPDNLVMTSTGKYVCNDPANPTTANACDITLIVGGNMEMQAGAEINADNTVDGGHGGAIKITVCGNFTMDGPSAGNPGARISSQHLGNGTDDGGPITVVVGCVTLDNSVYPAVPICNQPQGDILIQDGATIISNSNTHRAGDIALYAGHNINVFGSVLAQGTGGTGHGGLITIDACCDLFEGDNGQILSTGLDPGPDRVHLQGCTVTIFGVVESQGPAHEAGSPFCSAPLRPTHVTPGHFNSACVEIWSGTTVVIDSTGTHKGEVSADTAFSGGPDGHGWVDIFANGDITIHDGTGNDHPGGTVHAVHANQYLTNGLGGDIDVESKSGKVVFGGNALQANDTANGGHGGTLDVEAGGAGSPAGDVALGTSSSQAEGAPGGGGSQGGGSIAVQSFHGDITGSNPGELNAGGGPPAGSVTLTSCVGPSYTGTSTPAAVPTSGVCVGSPSFPPLTPPEAYPAGNCAQFCSPSTPTPTLTPTPPQLTVTPGCPEDPNAVLTSAVDPTGAPHGALPVFTTLQPAYDAAGNGAVIGLFGKWKENVTLGNFPGGAPKSLKITQCTSAQITAADSTKPVWNITSTGKLLIVGPDSVGGTNGWFLNNASGGPHTLKSVRANGASIWGIRIDSDGNTVSWNDVSGNGGPGGILVKGNSNTLKGGTTGPNNNDGIKITGNNNSVSGATVNGNTGNGILVTGTGNQIKSNKASLNGADGFRNEAGNNTYSGNSSNTGGKENTGAEYSFVTAGTNGGSNRADTINVPKTSVPTKCPDFAQANTVCE